MPDPFTRSPELEAIVRRWLAAYGTGNADAVMNLFSSSDALTYVGSDAEEFLTGRKLRQGFAGYTDQIPNFEITDLSVTGWEHGDTGWAVWRGLVHALGTDKQGEFRGTFGFVLEDAVWRIVHIHQSNPVANIQAMGYEVSHFDDLVHAARATDTGISGGGSATIMFTDIADSSAIAEALGDARWTAIVRDHVDLIVQDVNVNNGRLVKSLGDGTMSTFLSAGSAMTAALAIQSALAAQTAEPHLQVRIGLHTGDVVEAGDDFFGTVVNKAARIASIARPGEIRVSDATRVMVGSSRDFTFRDPATVQLKGLEGDHLIYRLQAP